jgi:hypothetical protein
MNLETRKPLKFVDPQSHEPGKLTPDLVNARGEQSPPPVAAPAEGCRGSRIASSL